MSGQGGLFEATPAPDSRARRRTRTPEPKRDALEVITAEQRAAEGHVPDGWQPSAWTDRLRQLASRCEKIRPDLARVHRAWADKVSDSAAETTR